MDELTAQLLFYKNLSLENERKLEKRDEKIRTLTAKLNEMKRIFKADPSDRWYIGYLQKTIMGLENECANRQDVIEKYQKDYTKYGTFYKRWQEEHEP